METQSGKEPCSSFGQTFSSRIPNRRLSCKPPISGATVPGRESGEKARMRHWAETALMLGMGAIFLAVRSPDAFGIDRSKVGIAMPNTAEARWVGDGTGIAKSLEALGYKADLKNAGNIVSEQIAQIEDMIANDDAALVIAPIDDSILAPVLSKAAAAGIKVIAYDRLIRGTTHVDYFATFDNLAVGRLQAQSLLRGLGIPAKPGPFNIELFAGSPNDANARLFRDGAMLILQPLIDSGTPVVRSNEVSMRDIETLRWSADMAHARMDNLLSALYEGPRLDGVLSPNDEISGGIIASLMADGYGRDGMAMPILTGQDCEVTAVKAIIAGRQYSSIFKDTRHLAEVAAQMAVAAITGKPVPVNDAVGYDNGAKMVPAYVLAPVLVDRENIEEKLIRTGYYTKSQID
jgi:putative multiple sugar transport system substrate-binding protein